ncbi:DUF2959 domain-containing protein [Halomonas sp. 18H]|uniref:DUF2959 domain-containing protein n=1 Tax=Halomonas almeriensis TaxID=308163 RepID=UPI00222ED862|nr:MULTISPECIES: DUF2959 domain-containing protein [Halomonas]MCW4152819.1 DUF2959 domain-containing protein [Halomonas sp. 18H]MDN3551982.1 DUF2959 domain-containing protein [Halomonas almeriensis]
MMPRIPLRSCAAWLLPLVAVLLLTGCQSAYYGALEKVGIHKRELMVDRVEEGRDAQVEAEQQFASALEQFRAVVRVPDSELSETYERLETSHERSEAAAERVQSRIDDIESVAEALFAEWEDELDLYQSAEYRRLSEQRLRQTRQRYAQMRDAMQEAADSMQPVLLVMRDNVLLLKHNLNARAIGALRGEVDGLEREVAALRERMQAAISRSNAFIDTLHDIDDGR